MKLLITGEFMKVKELKFLLNNIPDDYEIRTRAKNSNLDKDRPWQLSFSGLFTEVKPIHNHKIVMVIRGIE